MDIESQILWIISHVRRGIILQRGINVNCARKGRFQNMPQPNVKLAQQEQKQLTIYPAKTVQRESILGQDRLDANLVALDRFPKRKHQIVLPAHQGNMPVDLTTHANPVQKALILQDRLTVALSAL
jgi:hypothetical protein